MCPVHKHYWLTIREENVWLICDSVTSGIHSPGQETSKITRSLHLLVTLSINTIIYKQKIVNF